MVGLLERDIIGLLEFYSHNRFVIGRKIRFECDVWKGTFLNQWKVPIFLQHCNKQECLGIVRESVWMYLVVGGGWV